MNSIKDLRTEYENILNNGTTLEKYLDFEKRLISNNSLEYLELHYKILSERQKENLYKYIKACFHLRSDKIKTINFLTNKYKNNIKDSTLKADVIQILGHLRAKEASTFAKENLNSPIFNLRYSSIITLGWIGNKEDLSILSGRLLKEPDDTLRGYVATAMRQIWFNRKAETEDILPYLYKALIKEESKETLSMIIIVIQDLLKRKFGLQENLNEGNVKGDVFKAKEKIIKKLNLVQ